MVPKYRILPLRCRRTPLLVLWIDELGAKKAPPPPGIFPPPPGIPAPSGGILGASPLDWGRCVATNRHQFCLLRIITDPAKTEYQDSHRLAALLAGKPFLDPKHIKFKYLAPFLV